jgi:hypothetical protein
MTRHCECFYFVAAWLLPVAATMQQQNKISKPPQAAKSHEQLLNTSIAWKSKNTVISSSSMLSLGNYYHCGVKHLYV